jgi:hypothetical protein
LGLLVLETVRGLLLEMVEPYWVVAFLEVAERGE